MKANELHEGMKVHIDTDDPQWGRVAQDGVVAESPSPNAKKVLVNVSGTIRAGMRVRLGDISIR